MKGTTETVKTLPGDQRDGSPAGIPRAIERAGPLRLAAITIECALLLYVMHAFRVEETFGILKLTPLILGGFVINAILPLRWRMPFFLLLSLAGIVVVLGLKQGPGLIVLGFTLIGICHLPIAFRLRVLAIVGIGIGLAFVRAGSVETPWQSLPTLVLPILGAMFMFRLAIYLYDLRHEKKPVSVWTRLSYFFMLPNVCFPLFPVVDYQNHRRTYYNEQDSAIYQKGVTWICRGIIHLLLYRLIYYNFIPSPEEVQNLGGVIYLMVTTYLLYLRISGQFHLIIGIMCLFGFNLPETHHNYFLASSFSDYWRRINIYWKDFMMKLFYYPSFMKLRHLGMRTALVLSTIVVFAGTWLLHAYQWFWLQGVFPLGAPDALFWGILGLAVVINTLRELRGGKKQGAATTEWSLGRALRHSTKVVSTLFIITVLWTLWSSSTVGEFLALGAVAVRSGPAQWALLVAGLAGLVAIGVLAQYLSMKGLSFRGYASRSFRVSFAATCLTALLLAAVGRPELRAVASPQAREVLMSLHESGLNQRDTEQMNRGYYEGLLDSRQHVFALWRAHEPDDWNSPREVGAYRETGDLVAYELLPSWTGTLKRTPFRANQWGMHDREYTYEKPGDVFRIAQLGSSYAFGAGVAVDKTIDAFLEARLNDDQATDSGKRFEVLNFALGGYSVANNLGVLRQKAIGFEPDMILLILHTTELSRLNSHVVQTVRGEISETDPFIRDVIARSGATPDMDRSEIDRRLEPHLPDIFMWTLSEMVSTCNERGIIPVAAVVPMTEEARRMKEPQRTELLDAARTAGFVVLDLQGTYGDAERETLHLAPWDWHPNVLGNRLIADGLFNALVPRLDERER